MLGFLKKFSIAMTFFSCNVLNGALLKCVSMINQECKIRSEIININSNEPLFYSYSINMNTLLISLISLIHMQSYVLLMLLKTWMSKVSI